MAAEVCGAAGRRIGLGESRQGEHLRLT